MQNNHFYIESKTCQERKNKQNVCGDCCESRKIKDEDRFISVLSDGLGAGVKANVLSTITTSMALQFTAKNNPLERTAEFIMRALPVDSVRQMSYSTFTITDINCFGEAQFVEYDNPSVLIYRDGKFIDLYKSIKIVQKADSSKVNVLCSGIKLEKEDRIIIVSDGITQSGMGTPKHPFGWGEEALKHFIEYNIQSNPNISAAELAKKIIERAKANDANLLKDDATCEVIYCREPRKMVIASGPPYYKTYDKILAERLDKFGGLKVICGGTTSQIIARELNRNINVDIDINNLELPPVGHMEGIDLITEGILTLGKVSSLLDDINNIDTKHNGPAEQIVRLLMKSDYILILAGTQINNAHQDPNLPVELEIRRNIIKKIAKTLEDKCLKKVEIEYL